MRLFLVLLAALLLASAEDSKYILAVTEQLMFTTARLELWFLDAGEWVSAFGTGFFYLHSDNSTWIITNKHNLKHKKYGDVNHLHCIVHENKSSVRPPAVLGTKKFTWEPPREAGAPGSAIFHNLSYIDIAAIPFTPYNGPPWKEVDKKPSAVPGIALIHFSSKDIATNDELYEEVVGGDNVLMYGYPHQLVDAHHNLPIIRAGYLASLAYIDYSPGFGHEVCDYCVPPSPMPLGAADIACFPGSSGSPVVLVDSANARLTRSGNAAFGRPRFRLLGIAFGTILRKVQTQIKNIPITGDIEEDLHIGFYWKATEIVKLFSSTSAVLAPGNDAKRGAVDSSKKEVPT